jgi:hypothetical protein
MSEVATYVYCLLRSGRAPVCRAVPGGLPHCGKPRVLDAGRELWLVAADAPLKRYGQAALEQGLHDIEWVSRCAMAHEEVIEFFHRTPAVLPLKLFTLFSSDARASAFVRDEHRRLSRLLDRVEGRREWSVRVSIDPVAFAAFEDAPRPTSGTGFLARKLRLQTAGAERLDSGRRHADNLFRRLGQWASAKRRRTENETEPGSRLLLDAVYLVPLGQRARFTSAARKASADLARGGLALSVTGPWPPYHFAA